MGQLASKCFNVFNKDKICDISKDDDDNDNDKLMRIIQIAKK